MDINGYELESVAFMTRSGPLWHTRGVDGHPALVALRSRAVGEAAEERWKAWAQVEDPHVVQLLDVARHADGRWALVMERVEGRTLETLLAVGQPRDLASRRRIARGVRTGVEALHAVGLVHGDLSPANIVVRPDGTPVVVDLVDPVDGMVGTAQWSSGGTGGSRGDLDSVALVARALGVGGDEDGEDGVASPTPPAVGSGADAAAALRRLATSAETEAEDPDSRARAPRRAMVFSILAVLVLVGGVVASAQWWSRVAEPVTTRAAERCLEGEAVADLVEELLTRRDEALVAADPQALGAVLTGSVLGGDQDLLDRLAAEGTRLEELRTRVEDVEESTCGEDTLEVAATLRQDSLRRCSAAGECSHVGAQESHRVVLRLRGDPWKVDQVLPG